MMKKLLLSCLLALILSIVPLSVFGESDVVIVDDSVNPNLKGDCYGVLTGILFSDMRAGSNATAPLRIYNGKGTERTVNPDGSVVLSVSKDRVYDIYLTEPKPDELESGYTALSKECYSWITIGANHVPAAIGETVDIPITVTIPNNVIYENRHDAFALFVKDVTQTGLNQIAYVAYWYITTDHYVPKIPKEIKGISTTLIAIIVTGAILAGCGVFLLIKRTRGEVMPWQRS